MTAATAAGLLVALLAGGAGAWMLERQALDKRHAVETALAEVGLGVAILPAALFEGQRGRRVAVRPIQHARLNREIGVIRKFGRPLTSEAMCFLDCVQSVSKGMGLDTRESR